MSQPAGISSGDGDAANKLAAKINLSSKGCPWPVSSVVKNAGSSKALAEVPF